MILCIGLDPSLNSSGVVVTECDGNNLDVVREQFYIIHSGKLSKKEQQAEEKNINKFSYITYQDISKEEAKELSPSEFEYRKTLKLISVCDLFKELIGKYINNFNYTDIYICIEGISYGSTRGTKSIFDLAGLNYLLRYTILKYLGDDCKLIVAPPSHIKKFAVGKGNANKEALIEAFKINYPDFELPKIDDISDAWFMNRYAQQIAKEELL